MRIARERASSLEDDPVARIVAPYLDQHIVEEQDHDDWLLDDIGTLGISPEYVTHAHAATCGGLPPRSPVLLGPSCPPGHRLRLSHRPRGNPPLTEQLEDIRKRTGFPATAFRCLIAHADNDPHHIADLNRTLDSMPLSDEAAEVHRAQRLPHRLDAVASVFEERFSRCTLRLLKHSPQP